jgi:hypothetical protein
MPIKPDAIIWVSFLISCRIHNIMLGECIAYNFLGSNNKIVDHYVLMSNIYAPVGRWDDVEEGGMM